VGTRRVTVRGVLPGQSVTVPLPTNPDPTAAGVDYRTLRVTPAQFGGFVMNVSVSPSPPRNVTGPTPSADGLAPISYLAVQSSGPVRSNATLTFTVDRRLLEKRNVRPRAVGLDRRVDGNWTRVPLSLVNETGATYRYRGRVSTLSTLSTFVVGKQLPVLSVADLSLNRTSIPRGGAVTITATVRNDGAVDGTYRANLTAFGEVVASKRVAVPAGGSARVQFTQTVDAVGRYNVSVGGASAVVQVDAAGAGTSQQPTTDSGGLPGFGFVTALGALAVLAALVGLRARD